MTDDDQLAQRLKGRLEEELGDIQVRAGSRERLRRGLRERRPRPWLRASVLVPVGAAAAIAALVLAIPALLDRPNEVQGVPAAPPPAVSRPVDPPATVAPTPTAEPAPRETTDPRTPADSRSESSDPSSVKNRPTPAKIRRSAADTQEDGESAEPRTAPTRGRAAVPSESAPSGRRDTVVPTSNGE